MKAGVSTTPLSNVSRPRRAELSVLIKSKYINYLQVIFNVNYNVYSCWPQLFLSLLKRIITLAEAQSTQWFIGLKNIAFESPGVIDAFVRVNANIISPRRKARKGIRDKNKIKKQFLAFLAPLREK
jgi:hypothetical protein